MLDLGKRVKECLKQFSNVFRNLELFHEQVGLEKIAHIGLGQVNHSERSPHLFEQLVAELGLLDRQHVLNAAENANVDYRLPI